MPSQKQPTKLKPTKRPPLLLLHGFRGAPVGLKEIADALTAAGYDVHAPAIPPSCGTTLDKPYTAKNYADFVVDYITKHHLTRPVLIGHSMGSIIAAATAHFYPHEVNKLLVFMSPIPVRTPFFVTLASPLAAFAPPFLVDHITTRFLFTGHDRALYRHTMDITRQCRADGSPKLRDTLATIHFSTHNAISDFTLSQDILIIAGAHDRLVRQSQTQQLAKHLHAELHFMPNTGHLHNYEAPIETADLILDFLKAHLSD